MSLKDLSLFTALTSALWHEFEDAVPHEGKEYIQWKQHAKKSLVTSQDLHLMYTHFDGQPYLNFWCDGKD